jgi:hypothetical protein
MIIPIEAGLVYPILVFFTGFVFGTIRVLLLVPHLGETAAVSFILTASWFVCRWCVDRLDVPRRVSARIAMGVIAFVVLMLAELGLSVFAFRRAVAEFAAPYASLPGLIGLAAQIVFAAFPVVLVWRR